MRRYTAIIYYDDYAYTATVPALPGCVTQGDTTDEALDNARDAIRLYLEDLEEAGEPIPEELEQPELTTIEV
jgi:predicted RNase H-like HicB family nuclease